MNSYFHFSEGSLEQKLILPKQLSRA